MRRVLTIFVLVAGVVFASPAVGQTGWRIGYIRQVYDPAPKVQGYRTQPDRVLDVFGDKAIFYSEKAFQRDSLSAIAFDENGNIADDKAYGELLDIHGGGRDFTRIDLGSAKLYQYYCPVPCIFIGESPLAAPKWEITAEIKNIREHPCKKAKASFMGREWEAWFTEDISINFGPWLLWGLPGLVIEARDSKDEVRFKYQYIEPLGDNSRSNFLDNYWRTFKCRHRFVGSLKECEQLYTKFQTDKEFQNKMTGTIMEWAVDSKTGEPVDLGGRYQYLPIIPQNYWNEE